MNDTKRTILAFAVSFAILMGWYAFFTPKPAPEATPAASAATAQAGSAEAPRQAETSLTTATSAPAPVPVPAAVNEEKTVLKNSVVEIHLTNRGGRIEGVTLLKHTDKAGPGGKPHSIMDSATEGIGFTKLADSPLKPTAMYTVTDKSDRKVVYSYVTPEGIRVDKTYALSADRYDSELTVKVTNDGRESLRDRLSVYMVGDYTTGQSRTIFKGPAYSKDGGYEEISADDAAKGKMVTGGLAWAGSIQNFFMSAMVPKDTGAAELQLERDNSAKDVIRISLNGPAFELKPGASLTREYKLYAGPKHKDDLLPVGAGLESALYYGWFTIIAKPLLQLLNLLYSYVGNYGIAIIILTMFVKALFWPLSAKSYKSMARMKELQPKLDKLKERYGDDREKLNMEMMQLWKTHKVNPFSGCLPILVQIPVFIALYNVLMHSIEIRHAPFIFWLTDLSAPDPYYITPVLMGGSMFLQQKMTPATGMGDGQMKFMLYGMPIVFTWLFKDFASGLVLYWLMNNVFSIAQQAIMLRTATKKA